jgi:hypothetical protein
MTQLILMLASLLTSAALGSRHRSRAGISTNCAEPAAREQSPPEVVPSPRDPGMVKQPETVPHPDSVVTPPVVDPKMAINPEAAPPQPVEPPERPNQNQPPTKQ